MPFDKFYGMRSDGIGNVFIFPQCLTAALHITDSTDAIHDSHVMTMTRFLVIKQFRIVASGRFTFKIFLITHFNRSRFIVIGYLTILDKHTRNTVARCGHNVMIIKPQIAQRGREGSVPILLACLVAQSQMPLAECSGSISCTLEHVGHCILGWTDNHPCITGRNIGIRFAPGIFSSQQRIAGRCTGGSYRMCIGKADTFFCQLIDIRCFYILGSVTFQVSISQVVSIDDDDIRFLGRFFGMRSIGWDQRKQREEGDSFLHKSKKLS